MSEESKNVVVAYRHGCIDDQPDTVLRHWSGEQPPWWWFEPTPGCLVNSATTPRDLHPTLRPTKIFLPDDVTVDEARLFWPNGSLHLVAGDAGARWFQWWTEPTGQWVDWEHEKSDQVEVAHQPLANAMLRDSYDAFGMGGARPPVHDGITLKIQEYQHENSLFCWTLVDLSNCKAVKAND